MEGWIKLHRQIKEHWLWKSDNRLKWWIDILLTVNHNDTKVLIKGTLIDCKRGQSIRSLDSWAKEWNVSKGAVRDFFKLLESDQMLTIESLQITTRITVCKYEDYQDQLHTEKTQRKRKGNAEETLALPKQECKEGEECKECKEDIIIHGWRKNFGDYLKLLNEEYDKILSDTDFLETQQRYYPSLDIKLSLEKSIVNFWGTEAGWKHKKKSRSKEIDWHQTFVNAIPMNKVYKQNQSNGQNINNNANGKLAGTYKAAENLAREIEEKNRNFISPLFNSY